MPSLWIYKCNARNLPHQHSWGDWAEFFDDPGRGSWGGTRGIKSAGSRKILTKQMKPGDYILAYQTDQRAIIGLCKLICLKKRGHGDTDMILKPVERFAKPVPIHDLKHGNQDLERVRALRQGVVGTLYETTADEAQALLGACEARTRIEIDDEQPHSGAVGAGFGAYEQNVETERAAIRAVERYYKRRGWEVRSVEDENRGFDLVCSKDRSERHVEVKGIRGTEIRFMLTANEHSVSQTDRCYRLAVVTTALSKGRRIRLWTGVQFNKCFSLCPTQYAARLKPGGSTEGRHRGRRES